MSLRGPLDYAQIVIQMFHDPKPAEADALANTSGTPATQNPMVTGGTLAPEKAPGGSALDPTSVCHSVNGSFQKLRTHWICSAKQGQTFDSSAVTSLENACASTHYFTISST